VAEVNHQRIKSLYGEIYGILSQLAPVEQGNYSSSIGAHYNSTVDDLSKQTNTDYSRHKLTKEYQWDDYYDSQSARSKIGSLVSRLEQEYGFGAQNSTKTKPPVVVTVNQNQQVSVSVTPISQLIEKEEDPEIKQLLKDLSVAAEKKDEATSKTVIKNLADKSWQVFLQAIPYILERGGR